MAFTQAQYDALLVAIGTGAKYVKYSDKEVHYMSYPEMMTLKREMELDLGIIKRRGRKTIGVYDKGLDRGHGGRGNCAAPVSGGGGGGGGIVPDWTSITVFVKTTPDPLRLIHLDNGKVLYVEYAPGSTLTVMEVDGTVGYLGGKKVQWPFAINNGIDQLLPYNSVSGTIEKPVTDGDFVTINFIDG